MSWSRVLLSITTGADFGGRDMKRHFKEPNGIGDERMFWFQNASLTRWRPDREMPAHTYAKTGREYRETDTHFTKVHGSVGFRGYFAGPKVHIIDYYALAEPLLARLPARYKKDWRIGHFIRVVPPGYEQTVATGKNLITDKDLAEFYDVLSVIIKGPIWTRERWAAIWKTNLGAYDHLIDRDRYRFQFQQQ